ncbi:MoaD/ThiS family protein [Saccharophagus sp. K07]|jgi:molybdopterin synthase sulfur carrier subunit|uniref:MoaD/ThiS family protein n=1 Tax=Saccharophagus sp. K07 TaxID=2283636 RepID=UPI001651C59F|nr:MoaD/ThiS family protein [Saccharophagus sp. K07]MBC6904204.1 MoaD/ThiS family protein [Saccharophagus sp. K07]
MPFIVCTSHLRDVGPLQLEPVAGRTVREALQDAAQRYPRLLNYILDDQGDVRKHIAIFVDGTLQARDSVLEREVGEKDEIYVLQALSGG